MKTTTVNQIERQTLTDYSSKPYFNKALKRIAITNPQNARHVITKIEDHGGKEITLEELVDQQHQDPQRYFEGNSNSKHQPVEAGIAATTAIAVARTSIAIVKSLKLSKDDNIIRGCQLRLSLQGQK